jgi:hypothetical protein
MTVLQHYKLLGVCCLIARFCLTWALSFCIYQPPVAAVNSLTRQINKKLIALMFSSPRECSLLDASLCTRGASQKVFTLQQTFKCNGKPNCHYLLLISALIFITTTNKLHGLSPRANYTDRPTAACRRRDCQLLRIEGATWSAWRIPLAVFSVF